MKFLRGRMYRHKHCLDAQIYVIKVLKEKPDYLKVDVIWVNQRTHNSYGVDRIKVPRNTLHFWQEVPVVPGLGPGSMAA